MKSNFSKQSNTEDFNKDNININDSQQNTNSIKKGNLSPMIIENKCSIDIIKNKEKLINDRFIIVFDETDSESEKTKINLPKNLNNSILALPLGF